jgi:hypothetical protein
MLTPELKTALSGEMTPKFLATLDAEGRPNCVPVTSISAWDDSTLVFGEFFMNKTRRNLLENSRAGVAVINGKLECWSLKGTFQGFETAGPRVEWINQTPLFRYNAYTTIRSAGSIRVEEVSEPSCISRTRLLADFLHLCPLAPVLRKSKPACMPRRVHQKFRRIQSVLALAFRDRDGFPRTIPLMACVPAGPGRLLLRGPMLETHLRGMPAQTEVAVSVITMEPIAYQVKGRFQGCIGNTGVIGLEECYSASPPLLGERLDAGAG